MLPLLTHVFFRRICLYRSSNPVFLAYFNFSPFEGSLKRFDFQCWHPTLTLVWDIVSIAQGQDSLKVRFRRLFVRSHRSHVYGNILFMLGLTQAVVFMSLFARVQT